MTQTREPRSLSLGTRILIGLLVGIFAGLFFGEVLAPLKTAGDAFVGLLQMTVLPYIIVSLIANVGRLTVEKGRALVTRAALVWFVLVVLGSAVLISMCLVFPDRHTPSFFSTHLTDGASQLDLLGLFVPANIFRSLVENAVPGIVFFCICVGAALVGRQGSDGILAGLDAAGDAIARVNGFVVQLTPYGVFAIAAAAAGTMTLEEFGRLRGYFLVFGLTSFILTFGLLPACIAACTPFSYREVYRASRDALFTAFATGKVLVVLPMLVENTRRMFRERELHDEVEVEHTVEVLYPLIYPFPYLGKLVALIFIPFAAAFVGRAFELLEYPRLLILGTLSLFGGPIITIPFLLEAHELPGDMFQLFLLSGVLTSRLGDMVGVMNLLAFAVITTCALKGSLQVRWRAVAMALAGTAALVGLASSGSRAWLDSIKDDYRREKVIASMHRMDSSLVVEAVVLDEAAPNPVPLAEGQSRLERIRERGVLRVGYNDDNLPYVFRNGRGELVGLDVELAHALANDLGASLEFVPFARSDLARQLDVDHFDIAMSGLVGTLGRSQGMRLSEPYLDATFSLVVRDHRARDLDSYAKITSVDALRVGILTESQFAEALRRHVPQAETVQVESTRWFFEAEHDLDALILSGEAGAAWCILYPGFQVVVPTRRRVSMPFVYAMARHDEDLAEFVDFWVELQKSMGRIDDLSDYWIRGVGIVEPTPRWTILRDVLGWGT